MAAEIDEWLKGLFDALSNGVCLTTATGHVIYMNPAAERLLGVTLSQFQGAPLCGLLCGRLDGCGFAGASCPVIDGRAQAVTLRGRHGPTVSYDWRDLRVSRQQQWKNLRVRCERMAGPPGGEGNHLVIIEDVSAEAELERHREDWRHMVAHDLRAPMTNVFATLRLLQDIPSGHTVHAREKALVDAAVAASRRLLELLDLYLDLAKLDAALMPVRPEEVALLALAREGVEQQQGLARERGVPVEIDVPENLSMRADRLLLERVLQNLLNNAIKFSPGRSPVLVSACPAPEGKVRLSVKDFGPGVPEEDLPRLFDRFHQAEARRAGRTPGTGLGLAFCREATRVMGGEIDVDSRLGVGSVFTVTLPAGS